MDEENHEDVLKSQIEDELEDDNSEENLEEVGLHPVLQKIKEQVPSVFKLIEFIISKFPKKKKTLIKEELNKEDSTNKKEPKKKTKLKVIHIVFVVAFGFILFEEEILGTTEESDKAKETKVTKQKKQKVKPKPKSKSKQEKVMPNQEPPILDDQSDPLMIGAKNVETKEIDIKPDQPIDENSGEDITSLFKSEMNRDDSSVNNDTNDNVEPTVKDENIFEVPSDSESKADMIAKKEQEMIDLKKENDKMRVDSSEKIVNSKLKDDKADDFLIDNFDVENSTEDITNSIMLDLEKKVKVKREEALIAKNNQKYDLLDVVNYDVPGRGLVYNCADKHWACVTVKSYSYCQSNYKFDQEEQKLIQCFPKAIYESDYDCEAEQLANVSNSVETNFCN